MCAMCIALCTTVAHNTAQNRPDNFPSYTPANHHCSDDVYLRVGGVRTTSNTDESIQWRAKGSTHVEILHICHLTAHRVEVLLCSTNMRTVLQHHRSIYINCRVHKIPVSQTIWGEANNQPGLNTHCYTIWNIKCHPLKKDRADNFFTL